MRSSTSAETSVASRHLGKVHLVAVLVLLAIAYALFASARSNDSVAHVGVSDALTLAELWPAFGGGATEVDPASTLKAEVQLADRILEGRVSKVAEGPSYGEDPVLGHITYALLTVDPREVIKGEDASVTVQIPMYGEDLSEVEQLLLGQEYLLFLRSFQVDAERDEGIVLQGDELGYFRILNMHGIVRNSNGRATRPWASESLEGAPQEYRSFVNEVRRLAASGNS